MHKNEIFKIYKFLKSIILQIIINWTPYIHFPMKKNIKWAYTTDFADIIIQITAQKKDLSCSKMKCSKYIKNWKLILLRWVSIKLHTKICLWETNNEKLLDFPFKTGLTSHSKWQPQKKDLLCSWLKCWKYTKFSK